MNLPEKYVLNMKNLLGEEEYIAYEESLINTPGVGIRVNSRKISPGDFERISPFSIEKIPYTDDGYFINDTDAASKHPYYFAGLYYIQEPSAMVPASCANVDTDSYVLDLCAAPGGKTTEILSKNPAFLLSNDISYSRTIPLVKNIDLFGSGSVLVSAETPEKLEKNFEDFFDIILVDAPCSGEGMFRKDASLIKDWNLKGPDYYSAIQKDILKCASKMLCFGGEIIYSTCTFSPKEDEEIIRNILAEDESLSLCELKHYDGFCGGIQIDERFDFSKCIRLFPHKINGEGHFVAKLKKEGTKPCKAVRSSINGRKVKTICFDKLPESVKDFLLHFSSDVICDDYIISNDYIYMLPSELPNLILKELHYSRSGVLVGQLKNGKNFVPHNSIALYISMSDFDNVLNLKSENENIYKYLKGETLIDLDEFKQLKKGYTLVCVDGYPLGFAKFDGFKLKNLYTPGWRYNGN